MSNNNGNSAGPNRGNSSNREVSHYVVTAHPPGGVLHTVQCNFLSKDSQDVVIGKSRRLEVRQLRHEEEAAPFPVVFSCPINGRITSLVPLQLPQMETSLLFITTDGYQYALIGYNAQVAGGIETMASGSLRDDWTVLGTLNESGPLVAVDPHMRCVVLHLYDGLVTIFPILPQNQMEGILGPVFHARLEERTLLAITMLHHLDPSTTPPHLTLLHQDSRGAQHITTHAVDLAKYQLWTMTSSAGQPHNSHCEWLKKSRIDGGSSLLIPVPPRVPRAAKATSVATPQNANQPTSIQPSGGVVILGQRQITFCALQHYKVMPIPPALILSWDVLPPDVSGMPRFLLGDEFGNLHMLTLITQDIKVIALQLDTLGSCTLSQSLQYLDQGLVFCGSTLGDSQLIQIHDEPIPVEEDVESLELGETTYLSVVEEYTNLGPIVDFDLVPMAGGSGEQCQVVTASGSSKSGSLRVIRNGIGMKEYASVELSGIQNMWSLRQSFEDTQDTYLVQSFVGETRVLGVTGGDAMADEDNADVDMSNSMSEDPTGDASQEGSLEKGDEIMQDEEEDVGGSLEEVVLPGLVSNASTLNMSNVVGNLFLQITESQLRLANSEGELLDTIEPENPMTVATSNESGQILVALRGGKVLYFEISQDKIQQRAEKQMDREVSCLDVHPFSADCSEENDAKGQSSKFSHRATKSSLCAVGLWDDFTVRILTLHAQMQEVFQIHLSTEDDDGEDEGQRRNNRNNMMARSLCLITLDFSSSSSSAGGGHGSTAAGGGSTNSPAATPGVNMLFVGLGDGTLVSFTVVEEDGRILVQSKKEVSLGTQRINLIPLHNEKGGSCVLATGDRPTVIYLAGTSTAKNYNPKLCYSNVNLSPVDDEDTNDVSRPHAQKSIAVNVASPFFSPLLFDAMGQDHYSLCVADDASLCLGVIDDIQKLHVTTCRLGMAPRRIVHCPEGRLFAVGCIESGIKQEGVGGGDISMANCIRFLDDATFDDVERIDLEPYEMVLSMVSATLRVHTPSDDVSTDAASNQMESDEAEEEMKSFLIIGTAYALSDEEEPTRGRIIVLSCNPEDSEQADKRTIKPVTELQVRGGVYSMCQFYDGMILVTINSKTQLHQLVDEGTGVLKLAPVGVGHHGHILSLFVSSRASKVSSLPKAALPESLDGSAVASSDNKEKLEENEKEKLAIVGDFMRSISLVQYYQQHDTLEEVARDFYANWTTSVSMLTDDVYLGGESWNNLFVLRRNTKAQSEEVRCRLDTVGEFHLGEMCNKFMSGSLVMPNSSEASAGSSSNRRGRRPLASAKKEASKIAASPGGPASAMRSKRPAVTVGSQTLFGTVDGTLGVVLGLDGPTAAFFACLERSMQQVVKPVGNFSHQQFRAFRAEKRHHPSHGFVDGDLVESFLDLDKTTMIQVVRQMNRDGGWEVDDSTFSTGSASAKEEHGIDDDQRPELNVDDILAVVEEMTMLH